MNTIALQFLSGCCFVSEGWRVAGYQCRMIFNVVFVSYAASVCKS
jgi:hypothetical protein